MNNIFIIESSSSNDEITSSDSESESDPEVGDIYQSVNFSNQTKITDYEKNRNKYFTKNLILDCTGIFSNNSGCILDL